MKAAVFLSEDPDFAGAVLGVLAARGADVRDGVARLVENGPDRGMFRWSGKYQPDLEWEFRDPPWIPAPGVTLPDMQRVDGYYAECRWERQWAEIAAEIAAAANGPVWVQDGNGVIWDAAAIDPDGIVL